MNNYIEEWKFLCIRIEELENLLNSFLAIETAFTKTTAAKKAECHLNFFKNVIAPMFSKIFDDIKQWKEKNLLLLSQEVNNATENYFRKDKCYINKDISHDWSQCVARFGEINQMGGSTIDQISAACQAVLSIVALKAQLNSFFKSSDVIIKSLTDLAFEHLRRTIVVNEEIKNKWQLAKMETDFEKMGAIHLLSHGIWAFKAHGEKGRTDLVYDEPIDRFMDIIHRSAQGLVLTEWKKVTEITLSKKAKEAREQLKKYSNAGVLGGIELRSTRYIILVVNKTTESLVDCYDDNICYRHIIIQTNPDLPSKRGKKLKT